VPRVAPPNTLSTSSTRHTKPRSATLLIRPVYTPIMKTSGDVDPRGVIGAVFEEVQNKATRHLGTGSVIGDGTVVLTADHVIRDCSGQLHFAVFIDTEIRSFPLTVLESDQQRDLALLRLHGFRAPDPLHVVFDAQVNYNDDLALVGGRQCGRRGLPARSGRRRLPRSIAPAVNPQKRPRKGPRARRLFRRATADATNPPIAATVATASGRATRCVGPSDPYRSLRAVVW
jgi:hypothetical protein